MIYNQDNEKEKEKSSENFGEGGKNKMNNCIICLKQFNKNENLGILKCGHCFHIYCIINLFDSGKKTCPICKKKAI